MYARRLIYFLVAVFVAGTTLVGMPFQAMAAEKVSIAFNSFSPYANWYIVKERNLAKDIELDIQVIEGIPEKTPRSLPGSLPA